ncbi:MAG: pitrilysin family protein [Chloroflexota bacterium]
MNTEAFPNPNDIHRTSLDNGLVVLARANHSAPVVVLQGSLPTGAIHDPSGQTGLSSFVAAMLTRGTKNYDFDRFNEAIESVGASLSASSSTHRIDFNLSCLSEDFPQLVAVLADVLQHPLFPEPHIELVRTQRMIGIQEREQDTQSMAYLGFYEGIYGRDHPYGRSTIGYADTVPSIQRAGLVDFYHQRFTPNGTIMAISGDIETTHAVELIQQYFGDWSGAEADERIPPVPTLTEMQRVDCRLPDKVQSDLVIGCMSVPRYHADHYALRVADTVLGKFGMMGRLGEKIREEQGLAYYSSSTLDAELHAGVWLASAGVQPNDLQQAIDSILFEFKRLSTELISESELADCQAYMTGILPLSLETNAGVASILQVMEINNLGLDYLQRYRDIIYSIAAEDIQRVAQKYLRLDKYILSVAGPEM